MEKDKIKARHDALIIGGSAGSLEVLMKVLPELRKDLNFPIIIVLHRKNSSDSILSDLLALRSPLPLKETEDKQPLVPSHIYVAPADYHLLFERDKTVALDYSEKINFSRPSIDVAFESAAEVFGSRLACLLLSGANADGVAGLKLAKELGGSVAVQDPGTALTPLMPERAILQVKKIDQVLSPEAMPDFINSL
jgi:two-component system chemotaxis response regulator CheB